MKLDLHVHTEFSWDSIIRIDELKRVGKNAIAITDHDNIKAHKLAKNKGIRFIPGEEITTNLGHLLGYYITNEINEKGGMMDFFEALDKIKEQGGVSCFAHPFDKLRKKMIYSEKDFEKALKKVDIIEVYNSKNNEKNDRLAFEKAKELGKLKSSGSDSHQISRIFSAYVEVEDFDLESKSQFIKVLKKARPILVARRTFKEFLNLRIRRMFKIFGKSKFKN